MVYCNTSATVDIYKIFVVIEALKSVVAIAPVHIGDILLENAADSGVNVIATKEVRQR